MESLGYHELDLSSDGIPIRVFDGWNHECEITSGMSENFLNLRSNVRYFGRLRDMEIVFEIFGTARIVNSYIEYSINFNVQDQIKHV